MLDDVNLRHLLKSLWLGANSPANNLDLRLHVSCLIKACTTANERSARDKGMSVRAACTHFIVSFRHFRTFYFKMSSCMQGMKSAHALEVISNSDSDFIDLNETESM